MGDDGNVVVTRHRPQEGKTVKKYRIDLLIEIDENDTLTEKDKEEITEVLFMATNACDCIANTELIHFAEA